MLETNVVFNNVEHIVKVCLWKKGDPVPLFGSAVGIDTETELITDAEKTPPLVVMGVYNPEDKTCYITDWQNAQEMLLEVLKRDITIYLANAGFDYYELESEELQKAVTEDRVVDVLIRAALKEIATIGYIRTYKLVDACKNYLQYDMDKHEDEGDNAARVTFRRNKQVTDQQYLYLAIDCASTYYAGTVMGPQATETTHTRGQIVLYHITKNGMPYDKDMWAYCDKLLQGKMDTYREELLSYGFPDPYKKKEISELDQIKEAWPGFLSEWSAAHINEQYSLPRAVPGKATIKRMLLYGLTFQEKGTDRAYIARVLFTLLLQNKNLSKKETDCWNELTDKFPFLDACNSCGKSEVWPVLLYTWMRSEQYGKTLADSIKDMETVVESHPGWFCTVEEIKPKQFLQQKLAKLEADYKGLQFDRTEKTKELKCSNKDIWKLEDVGCKDPFLVSYNNFVHCQKYKSSFVNETYLCSDGRVRGRYGIVATGRTSCSKPNLQQYPSHDHTLALKNMFKPPEGTVFISTDYSFAELVSLAQACITKYGHSVLGTIINADVCPHYFFAGVMLGLISADVSFCRDQEEVARIKKYLKEHITKDERQKAKAVNFGLPGKMSAKRLYRHLRESGVKASLEDAEKMRNTWLSTFTEMKQHFSRIPMKIDKYARYGYRKDEDEEDDYADDPMKEKKKGRQLFEVTTITGFKRSRAVESAVCNCDFQNPVAHMAKEAMWNLECVNLGPRLLNFVHDEVDYWLYPHEVRKVVPIVEKLWLEPGKRVFPDVMLKCETSLSLYWDKGGVDFTDVKWDCKGWPILEVPDFVKQVHKV